MQWALGNYPMYMKLAHFKLDNAPSDRIRSDQIKFYVIYQRVQANQISAINVQKLNSDTSKLCYYKTDRLWDYNIS